MLESSGLRGGTKMRHRPWDNIVMIQGLGPFHEAGRKGWGMPQEWKKFLSLDFAADFTASFLKLLLVVNPIWTFAVSFFSGERVIDSIFFRWGWDFAEATLVCLFGMGAILAYLEVERIWVAWSNGDRPRHGTGWYLLFLAFLVPPGLVAALHLMIFLINRVYIGPAIEPSFQWFYYGK
ncbi:MAG: hypothetical protein ACREL1_06700, partial [bacterium]